MKREVWRSSSAAADDADEAAVRAFLAADDVIVDRALFPHDIAATKAHVNGLERIGVIGGDDAAALRTGLDELASAFASGAFVLDDRYEDGHSAIEAFLTERLGDAGKRVHTGRSRNDQVLIALRLFARAELRATSASCVAIARAALDRAERERDVPMPGYTHLQRAVPSSVGYWMAGLAEAFLDDAALARSIAAWLDASPLGTAAGYGVNVPLDRAGVAAELAMPAVIANGINAQNARGKMELAVLSALAASLLDLRRFAWDLSFFTTAEASFVRLPDVFTTGSSLMPNKRNPDVVELLRAAYARCHGAQAEIAAVLSLPSGYHRDLQATKAPFVEAMTRGARALALVPRLVERLEIDRERMRAAITSDLYATDRAVEAALRGEPFRDAYRAVKDSGASGAGDRTPEASLAARVSPGGHADLGLASLRARLDELS